MGMKCCGLRTADFGLGEAGENLTGGLCVDHRVNA
jgi:hypothetical protein